MQYSIKITKGLDDNPDAKFIRQKVFVEEQGFIDEFDDMDEKAWHLVLYQNNNPVATGRLFSKDAARSQYSQKTANNLNEQDGTDQKIIGRVAVMQEYRGRSLGEKIMLELERVAKEKGAKSIELSAQERAIGFYEKLGYKQTGDLYFDEFCPHRLMEKRFY